MREYGKVSPQFWIGTTGKALRKHGVEAQLVALYLMTNPHANMLGLYYLPTMFIAHETGMGLEGASKGLSSAIEAGFCSYDEASEVVWIHEMASYQVGTSLKAADLRVKGVQNEYDSLPENPYLAVFYGKYRDAFHMSSCRGSTYECEAPSKPLLSQEQEQEQEQEHNNNPDGLFVDSDADDLSHGRPKSESTDAQTSGKPSCPHQQIIALYHELLPANPLIRDWTPARAAHLRTRWAEDDKRQKLEWWRRFFAYIADSEFLTGRSTGKSGKPFTPGLDWIVKAENFAKIREGRFHDQEAA
ncbi:hypothetical protein OYT13_13925 [Pandoraea sp. XJJ-1]|uniref:hypothetical protein n=1 Tax=Pandoraea sp. XJJ-1 TaxID=3002643 RepID=UPI00227EF910|nr:hypothetical protein [Pandoraea sp. XJJ-1]WAL80972.1 hypothetical protein OYT13_13925 [Pandoraea sp. XJJ-1]